MLCTYSESVVRTGAVVAGALALSVKVVVLGAAAKRGLVDVGHGHVAAHHLRALRVSRNTERHVVTVLCTYKLHVSHGYLR